MPKNELQAYELTTSLSVPLMEPRLLEEFAARLDSAVYETSAEYATMKAYFVVADVTASEISIGFRFEGTDARYVEEIAAEILESSMKLANETDGPSMTPVREESTLVPA